MNWPSAAPGSASSITMRSGAIYFSPRWKELFGYREDEIDGGFAQWRRLVHPEDLARMQKTHDDFMTSGALTVNSEYRLMRKDGSYRWISSTGIAVRDERKRATRVVGSHTDITDRKLAEDALAREHRTIKHLLESSDHERQVIAYEIHDGLTQYLAGAIMQFQAFEHGKDSRPDDAAAAFAAGMAMLRQSHAEARRLISGVRPPILDVQGIHAAVHHLVHEQEAAGGPAIDCRSQVEFSRLAPTVENAIYRIVQEGLTNACRHSQSDKVWVELVQHGEQLRIEIRDRGVGFRLNEIGEGRFGLRGHAQTRPAAGRNGRNRRAAPARGRGSSWNCRSSSGARRRNKESLFRFAARGDDRPACFGKQRNLALVGIENADLIAP